MKAWFRSRSRREQRLILVMFGLALIVLVWLLVLRPLDNALAAAKERHGAAVVALAEARAQAAEIARLEQAGGGAAAAGPLDSVLARAAAEAGFQLSQIQPAGADRATVAMEAARPQPLFAWVAAMEASGLIVERLSARANADRTIAVEVAFRRRRG